MDQDRFAAIDRYIDGLFVPDDPMLQAVIASAEEADLPKIHVSPGQGKLLYLLAKLCGARRILEIGTLAGYSTIWMARALPADGSLTTLEFDPKHAALAQRNLTAAGLADRVEVVVGNALESLAAMAERGVDPFDMVFIDADKPSYSDYLQAVLHLTRSGSLLVADNVIRAGKVLAPEAGDESAQGARDFNAALACDPRVEALVLQQVGAKGQDGLALAIVN